MPDEVRPGPPGGGGPKRSWLAVTVGVALVALGAGTYLIGSSLAEPSAGLVGGNLPVGTGATDLRNIDANNSPSLARNPARPTNLVVSNRVDSPGFSCALHLSFDGGASWERGAIPFPEGEELPERCFAPDVTFDGDGRLYVSFVTLIGLGNSPNAVWVSTSDDGGRTLSTPSRLLGPLAFQVRILADPAVAGTVYLSWVQAGDVGLLQFAGDDNPLQFMKSVDGARTWTDPVRVNPASSPFAVAPSMAVGPDGALSLLFLDLGNDRLDYRGAHQGRGGEPYDGTWSLVLARSADGGRTWEPTVVDGGLVPTERFVAFLPPVPSLAVDGQGRVHVAFQDGRLGDADVWVWTSTDAGRSFRAPVRVNDTPEGDGTSQYLPRLGVAPDGRLDVVYYDRRADPEDVANEVSLQWSRDGGRTFAPRIRLSDQAFSSKVGFGTERGLPDLGSRLAVLSSDERALAVWPDTRAGTEASLKQDLAQAVAAFSPGSSSRGPLRLAGGLLAAAGLVVALLGLRSGRARSPAAAGGDGGGDDARGDLPDADVRDGASLDAGTNGAAARPTGG